MNEMMQRFATENEQLKLNMNEIKTALGDVKTAVSCIISFMFPTLF